MKKQIAILTLLVMSNQALANPLNDLERHFSQESKCGRKVRKEIREFEKSNPGKLYQLEQFKGEVERMDQMRELRSIAINSAKAIESENGGNLTLDSFFNSNKPLKERMIDKSKNYHPVTGPGFSELIRKKVEEITFRPFGGDEFDAIQEEKLESEARTWYDWESSTNDRLVLNVEFSPPKINCEFREVHHPVKVYKSIEEAKEAYEIEKIGKDALSVIRGEEVPIENTYAVEGEHYFKIDGKVFSKDCDRNYAAPAGTVQVAVTKDQNGQYQYETMIAETNLVDPWNNSQEHADMAELLAQMGFVERVEEEVDKEAKRYYQGMPLPLIKNEAALQSYIAKAEKVYGDYFQKKIGKACYEQYLAGNIQLPVKKSDTRDDQAGYETVQSLNRSLEVDKSENRIAVGGANSAGSASADSY